MGLSFLLAGGGGEKWECSLDVGESIQFLILCIVIRMLTLELARAVSRASLNTIPEYEIISGFYVAKL